MICADGVHGASALATDELAGGVNLPCGERV